MQATQDERWLPVPGYEGIYEVSDRGGLRSVDRYDANKHFRKARVLRQATGGTYARIALQGVGKPRLVSVHRLVAAAFLGPCPEGMEVCHNNGDPHDNRVENLRYDTHSNNLKDAIRQGTHFYASRTHCKRGHEFTPENTRIWGTGRKCLACKRIRSALYREKARAA